MGAFNGSGTFVRSYSWVTDAANGVDITASRVDTEDDGFAAGLSNCITRDGQGKATASQLPATTSAYDFGSASFKWKDGYFSGNIQCSSVLATGQAVYKGSTTARSNTTTLAADPDLVLSIVTPGMYALDAMIGIWGTTTSTQGIKYQIYSGGIQFAANTVGGVAELFGAVAGSAVISIGAPLGTATTLADMGTTSAQNEILHITGSFLATALDHAVLGFAWAQNSSSANATNVSIASYLRVKQIA